MSTSPRGSGRRPAPVPRIRLVDVAREAGLSKTTVSAALNGTGRLSDAVRLHAQETARRLGYRPNATARLLRAGHARLIGYAVREYVATPWSYMESPYYAQVTSATAQTALTHGYALVLLPTHSARDEWADLPLDAAVVADPETDDPLVEDFLAARIPIVSDRRVEGVPGAHWVDIDHEAAVRGVLDHLEAGGARRIGLVAALSTSLFYVRALEAYHAWCAERGMRPLVDLTRMPGNHETRGAIDRLLDLPDPPDALFVLSEASPPLILETVRRHGLRLPDDLLLVCVSEDPTAAQTDPPVTTLSLCPVEIATVGVELLIEALESGDRTSTGRIVETRLEVRGTSRRG
ncbi:LacI family DNA-binding transcriptional regulator [Streptomyces sp. SID3343]|uniref:LacI family DNA-binding transcriptional regulator n=1 Tax=Streptomyces sp. SID3343 TaxID=2690260 RepID=UPI00136F38F9|nr:LacI family DNA-binding transcriptional regulator [Streptomyces sp. SID3343]MYW04010.1 substrate-binding domain-containing protein [Streptomyces sp. SID3343]